MRAPRKWRNLEVEVEAEVGRPNLKVQGPDADAARPQGPPQEAAAVVGDAEVCCCPQRCCLRRCKGGRAAGRQLHADDVVAARWLPAPHLQGMEGAETEGNSTRLTNPCKEELMRSWPL